MVEKKKLEVEEVQELLQNLIAWDALELCLETETKRLLIPYVMNDAVEQYLVLESCNLRGELEEKVIAGTQVEAVAEQHTQGVILRQPSGNMVSIWFQSAILSTECYQYHMIGHAWRKQSGEEYIRRLVNLICVLHDKRNYLGEAYCSEIERQLADLAEFPPVLYYTPINENIFAWYPVSEQGIRAMHSWALAAGDETLAELTDAYYTAFLKEKIKEKHIHTFARHLLEKSHIRIWEVLQEKITEASLRLPEREYEERKKLEFAAARIQAEQKYRALGFSGQYPCMQRAGTVTEQVQFMEEQPFTVMEAEDYPFQIYAMQWKEHEIQNCTCRKEE